MPIVYNKMWGRHSDVDSAVDRILDAAGLTFAELGVAKAKMVDVAGAAGCSRGTLYRYFPNQEALHLAFVHRATLRIARRIAADQAAVPAPSLTEAFTERILAGIDAVRSDPLLAIWFEPENMAVPILLSQNSELLRDIAADSFGQFSPDPLVQQEIQRRGEWLLRSIVSLLAMPGADQAAERHMIESYLVPVLLAELPTSKVDQ